MYIFWFRRDLRLVDNTGLNWIVNKNTNILPIFIFDKKQIDREKNSFFSDKSVQFLVESLKGLEVSIKKQKGAKLNIYYGDTRNIIEQLLKDNDVKGVVCNEDYTPFSINRDRDIQELCAMKNKEFISLMDIPLYDFTQIKTKSGSAYKRFKWFHQSTKKMSVDNVVDLSKNMKFVVAKKTIFDILLRTIEKKYNYSAYSFVNGGRKEGLRIMREHIPKLKDYKAVRQFPLLGKRVTSSHLSAYNKYGCISIRELFYTIKNAYGVDHELIRQIVWRDFYYNLVYYYPDVFLNDNHSLFKDYSWNNDQTLFKAWCEGKTGYPFVDAGMRQLNREGYMANRLRLCCASFLIKNLDIDWRWGEKYFATKLVDYDPSQNNGNWQWVSSTGYESQAYYRYINPIKDLLEFDPECLYVKKYISELENVSCTDIHSNTIPKKSKYPDRIVDVKETLERFKSKYNSLKDETPSY